MEPFTNARRLSRGICSGGLLLAMLVAGCSSACPTNASCNANLRLTGKVTLGAQTTSLDVKVCFNSTCQDVALDLENQRCASLDIGNRYSAVCASAPKSGSTTVSIGLVLSNSAVHAGDRYAVSVSDAASGDVLASQTGAFNYTEATSSYSACDLPSCKTATVSF